MDREQRQDGTLPVSQSGHRFPIPDDLQRAEDPDVNHTENEILIRITLSLHLGSRSR